MIEQPKNYRKIMYQTAHLYNQVDEALRLLRRYTQKVTFDDYFLEQHLEMAERRNRFALGHSLGILENDLEARTERVISLGEIAIAPGCRRIGALSHED